LEELLIMELTGRYYEGIGRRKAASARVRLYAGDGGVVVNDKPLEEYFGRERDRSVAVAPLVQVGMRNAYTLSVKVNGGGITGQADAIAHGLARALLEINPDLRGSLRKSGFLTRDPRAKERKKPGLKRARKAPQYTKR
jgi:small subunit ribosomal protein S9